jgi:patatin-like phospholipase/acyl hydrolase
MDPLLQTQQTNDAPLYALVLDGGGIRGIFTAEFLKCLEEYLIDRGICTKSIHGVFKLFSGTSTGAIIAACLATGKYSAKSIAENIYTNENGRKIFSMKQNAIKSKLMLCPKYHPEPRYLIGKEYFGNTLMYDLKYSLLVTTYNLRCRKPYFWNNINSIGPNPKVLDVVMASSAAPTYFPAEQVFYEGTGGNNSDISFGAELKKLMAKPQSGDGYIDGGVACNSPSTITLGYMKELYPNKKIKVLSVGTGANLNPIEFDDAKNAGGLWWLTQGDLISITMDSSDQVNQIESELLDDENFLRINLTKINKKYVSLDMDNTDEENMVKLRGLGKQMFENYKSEIDAFFCTN